MPNWCSNVVVFRHDKPSTIRRVVDAFNDGRLMQEFSPCPQDLLDTTAGGFAAEEMQANLEFREKVNLQLYGYANWYDWCMSEWGTRSDVGAQDGEKVELASDDAREVTLSFHTAWSPPIEFYKTMESLGFEVYAMYHEPGMGYCGSFDDGVAMNYQIPLTPEGVRDKIPADIDECFAISETASEWDED